MPVFASNSLPKIESNYHNFQEKEVELVAFPNSLLLEVKASSLLKIEELNKTFYSLYNKLFYLFNYLDYQVKFISLEINKIDLQDYLKFLYFNPFLGKEKKINLLIDQWNLLDKVVLRRNILYLPRVSQKELTALRSDILM